MLAIHIDSDGGYQAVAAWAASKGIEKRMLTKSYEGALEGATLFWGASEGATAKYKAMGAKPVKDADVAKWLKEAESPAETDEAD